jgi:hypothetical protein
VDSGHRLLAARSVPMKSINHVIYGCALLQKAVDRGKLLAVARCDGENQTFVFTQ